MERVTQDEALNIIRETIRERLSKRSKDDLIEILVEVQVMEASNLSIAGLSNRLSTITGKNLGVIRTDLGDTE